MRVKRGDRVRAGQELARLGNSGNTSAPHLHLHVMTTPSALAGDGIPYVFAKFTLAGMLDAEQWYAPEGKLDEPIASFPATVAARAVTSCRSTCASSTSQQRRRSERPRRSRPADVDFHSRRRLRDVS